MSRVFPIAIFFLSLVFGSAPLHAQMPFYTDDTSVTEPKKIHVEIFDEFDGLQSSQFPDERQNTANVKINFSPWNRLELDLDVPYLRIQRAPGSESSHGIGDTNLGAKWNLRAATPDSYQPTLAVSFYVEFPTGDARQELGSGLTDYWLNFIIQKTLSDALANQRQRRPAIRRQHQHGRRRYSDSTWPGLHGRRLFASRCDAANSAWVVNYTEGFPMAQARIRLSCKACWVPSTRFATD